MPGIAGRIFENARLENYPLNNRIAIEQRKFAFPEENSKKLSSSRTEMAIYFLHDFNTAKPDETDNKEINLKLGSFRVNRDSSGRERVASL